MKIKTLFLKAFGPFTNQQLDFGSGTTNLHLIYGPNEAGKSSALRAMTDLRFGIPQQSRDNFVHEHKHMAIAGTFIDAEGNVVSMHRRKGRENTLSSADPISGDSLPDTPVAPQVELILTGGLDRKQFESMFGLDHQRLREGGKNLIHDDGEVGTSLFEASSGTANVKSLLATLKEDVKQYHSARGHSATLNAARKRLDEQKKIYKEAQTKPKTWKDLDRDHQKAKEELVETNQRLAALRKAEAELTELRTVQPLLKQHDETTRDLEPLVNLPLLAEDAREKRITAEQALLRASEDVNNARLVIEECKSEATNLVVEPALLTHAAAIERLGSDADAVRRNQTAQAELEIKAKKQQELLLAAAKLISSSASTATLLDALPSAADRVVITEQLELYRDLERQHRADEAQAKELNRKLSSLSTDTVNDVNPAQQKLVTDALRQAQNIGDYQKRLKELDQEITNTTNNLKQALSDLGLSSTEALESTRPLLSAEIETAEQSLKKLDSALDDLEKEDSGISRDLSTQKNRLGDLKAEGELATLRTLAYAREHRNDGWERIKKAYVLGNESPDLNSQEYDEKHPLPVAFEQAQSEADRQADILRENAERSAVAADCEIRIKQMTDRLLDIQDEIKTINLKKKDVLDSWYASVNGAGLPRHLPTALREWQGKRIIFLSVYEEHLAHQRERNELFKEATDRAKALVTQLKAAGEEPYADEQALPELINQAQDWLHAMTNRTAQQKASTNIAIDHQRDLDTIKSRTEDTLNSLKTIREFLESWQTRLMLPENSPTSAMSARLGELELLATESRLLDALNTQIDTSKVASVKLLADAQALATLLGEPDFIHVMDFVDRIKLRLASSQSNTHLRQELERRENEARALLTKAETATIVSTDTLLFLCHAASVRVPAELPSAEAQSSRKLLLQGQQIQLASQIRHSYSGNIDELRNLLMEKTSVDLDEEKRSCTTEIEETQESLEKKRESEQATRRALEQIDDSGKAATAREAMESALADYRAALKPWAQLKLAESLLETALSRFKERAQAPMIKQASEYFRLATGDRYLRLVVNDDGDQPVLMAERNDGTSIGIEGMSEGTADQLYLSLRLAALDLQTNETKLMPLVLDDVLITSDDERTSNILKALARFSEKTQVLLFTHHIHLLDIAKITLSESILKTHHI